MIVEFILLGAMAALVEPSSATKQCKAVIGTKIETEQVSKILTEIKSFSFAKREFETSAEYLQRTQGFKSLTQNSDACGSRSGQAS